MPATVSVVLFNEDDKSRSSSGAKSKTVVASSIIFRLRSLPVNVDELSVNIWFNIQFVPSDYDVSARLKLVVGV